MLLTREQQQIIITRARDRIADPAHWCRGRYAAYRNGFTCNAITSAYAFCAKGALIVEALPFCGGDHGDALLEAERIDRTISPPGRALVGVNDSEGHKAVLDIFDRPLPA